LVDFVEDGIAQVGFTQSIMIEADEVVEVFQSNKRGQVETEAAERVDISEMADANELVASGPAAEPGMVADGDVTTEEDIVSENIVIAEANIVAKVDTGLEIVVMPQAGDAAGG
jgi:hypothetical protein